MKIVVVGGSGLIGSKVVDALRSAGHDVVSAALDTGVDTVTCKGLADVMTGAAVVVDASNSPSYDDAVVAKFFETSTRNLLQAERDAGVNHHVLLSIVGTDRLHDSAYYRAKAMQERLVSEAPQPWSVVRSTQFFEFIEPIAHAAFTEDAIRVPPVFVQPIAADDASHALAHVAAGSPLNRVLEIAGPQQFLLDDLIRRMLSERGDSTEVVADPSAPYFGGHLDDRTLVPAGAAELGSTDLDHWLRRPAGVTRR